MYYLQAVYRGQPHAYTRDSSFTCMRGARLFDTREEMLAELPQAQKAAKEEFDGKFQIESIYTNGENMEIEQW